MQFPGSVHRALFLDPNLCTVGSMVDVYERLEEAISDVGHWAWWDGDIPNRIQVEFGGVQMWNDPTTAGGPPSDLVALRFDSPGFVAFLTFESEEEPMSDDWPQELRRDEIGPFSIDQETFTCRFREQAVALGKNAKSVEVVHGPPIEDLLVTESAYLLAFRCHSVGIVVAGPSMKVLTMEGEIGPDEILDKCEKWWVYWKEYWARLDSDEPLPYDYACEVTIPAGDEE